MHSDESGVVLLPEPSHWLENSFLSMTVLVNEDCWKWRHRTTDISERNDDQPKSARIVDLVKKVPVSVIPRVRDSLRIGSSCPFSQMETRRRGDLRSLLSSLCSLLEEEKKGRNGNGGKQIVEVGANWRELLRSC